jgi:tRNA-dihydrouridine synthase B
MIAYIEGRMNKAQNLINADEPQIQIGPVRLTGRAILAPMAGVTDFAMRGIAERFGASATISEMIAGAGVQRGDGETVRRLRASAAGVGMRAPRAVQIAARDVSDAITAARCAEASGADWIDINMGCPCKRVTGGLAGAALMRDLDQAVRLIAAARAAVAIPVTVKMRLGWDDASRNAPELARRAEAEGVALITVHGRTRQQFYTGRADWAAIAEVASAVRIPVIANGDCASPDDALEMLRVSGADAAMIGRAAQGRPWLVGDIAHFLVTGVRRPPPDMAARKSLAREHLDGLLTLMGVDAGLRHARKHLCAYVDHAVQDGLTSDTDMRRALVTTPDHRTAFGLIERIFSSSLKEAAA